jgi:hypothetical protein
MVYGELGRYPIDIDIKVRMISYWSKLILGNQSKISSLSYKLLYIKDFQNKNVTCYIVHMLEIHLLLADDLHACNG